MRCTREELEEVLLVANGYTQLGGVKVDKDSLLEAIKMFAIYKTYQKLTHDQKMMYKLVSEAYKELMENNKITFLNEKVKKENPMKESTITIKPLKESTFKPVEVTLQINNKQDVVALLAALLPSVQEVENSIRECSTLSVSQKKALIEGNHTSNLPHQLFSDLEDIYPLADL